MQRSVCSHCGARQPREHRAGELCLECGRAVRVERLCPWCTTYSPEGRYCRQCGCELPDPDRFGAARMLKEGGVDRFSLGGKLREMDPELLDTLQRRWEEQRAVVLRRVEEAGFCESFLLQVGYAAELEEDLLTRLPLDEAGLAGLAGGPTGPFGEPGQLERIEAESPLGHNRDLAALALVRRGEATREVQQRVAGLLGYPDRFGTEAALALGVWRFHEGGEPGGIRVDLHRLAERAEAALDHPGLAAWAALACARPLKRDMCLGGSREEAQARRQKWERLGEILRAGLDARDPDLRLTAALLLDHREVLQGFLDAGDQARQAAVRRALADLGGSLKLVMGGYREEDSAERLQLIERSPVPPDVPDLEFILAEAQRADPQGRVRLWRFLRRCGPDEHGADNLGRMTAFVERQGPEWLPLEEWLDLLTWATAYSGYQAPRLEESRRPFHRAVSRALQAAESGERAGTCHHQGFTVWLWWADEPLSRSLLDAWAADPDPAAGKSLFESMSALDSYAHRLEAAGLPRAREILFGIWDRTPPEKLPLVAANLADGWSWSYRQDDQGTLVEARARYTARESERPLIRVAFKELVGREGRNWTEEHRKLLPGLPPGGSDPERTFGLLCRLEPDNAYDHVRLVLEGIDPPKAAPIAGMLFDHLERTDQKPTRRLPPVVAYARWLEKAAGGHLTGKPLVDALDAYTRGWEAVKSDLPEPRDRTESHYQHEKIEEIDGILAKVTRLI